MHLSLHSNRDQLESTSIQVGHGRNNLLAIVLI